MSTSSEATTVIGKRRRAARTESRDSYMKRRDEIGRVAVQVFNRLGYGGASLSAVAAELGIDRASLYYYFSSKEQLFDEITRSVLTRNADIARRIADSKMSPTRKLRELTTTMMVSYAEHYPLLYIYIRENLSHVGDQRSDWSLHMRKLNRNIESSIIDIVEQGFADGSFRRVGSARTVSYGILGMLNWSHRWYRPGQAESAEEVGKTFAEMVTAGLEALY